MKVLYFTPWYPSANDTMSGLFVEKIVDCAKSRGADCRVISETNLWKMAREAKRVIKEWGKPDLVHLHVATKQGIIPMLMKRKWGIPYIVTEHWSGYLEANGDYERLCGRVVVGRCYRRFTQKLIKGADAVTAVSDLLRGKMRECGLDNSDFRVIHNVVDPVFEREGSNGERMSFLHVSCFSDRAKNVRGIIEAARMLRDRGVEFRLSMVGEGPDLEETMRLSERYGLGEMVRFTGVLESGEVAEEMKKHDCLILFSNFETAAVVLQEAMSMGMAIISTPVGIAEEYEGRIKTVGIGDTKGLADAMEMSDGISNRERIGFSEVGDEYFRLYQKVLGQV